MLSGKEAYNEFHDATKIALRFVRVELDDDL
jgi:hypothetical protein